MVEMAGNNGKRERAARSDAEIRAIQKDVEKVYGLPAGSVEIVDPKSRKNIRDDAKIKNVRAPTNSVKIADSQAKAI